MKKKNIIILGAVIFLAVLIITITLVNDSRGIEGEDLDNREVVNVDIQNETNISESVESFTGSMKNLTSIVVIGIIVAILFSFFSRVFMRGGGII